MATIDTKRAITGFRLYPGNVTISAIRKAQKKTADLPGGLGGSLYRFTATGREQ